MNTEIYEKAADQMLQQAGQAMNFAKLCQTHTEKFTDLWTSQTLEAMKESQKLVKEWWSVGNRVAEEMTKSWEANVRETVKMFAPRGTSTKSK